MKNDNDFKIKKKYQGNINCKVYSIYLVFDSLLLVDMGVRVPGIQ